MRRDHEYNEDDRTFWVAHGEGATHRRKRDEMLQLRSSHDRPFRNW